MTIQQLRIFAAVAEQRSITKAAKALHVSHPSVSQHLKSLEEECGAKLYKKVGRGIELTDKGQLFLSEAEPILFEVKKLNEKFKSKLVDRKAGTLVVGGSHGPSASFLPLLLTVFKETHPQVELTLRTDRSRTLEQLVLNQEVELAVITNPSHSAALAVEPYWEEKFVIFGLPTHPLAKKRRVDIAELVSYPFVIKRGHKMVDRVGEILKELERRGSKVNVALYCDSPEGVKTSVKKGKGLGFLYLSLVQDEIRQGNIKVINVRDLPLRVTTSIIYGKDKPLSSNAQDFLTLLRKWPRKAARNASPRAA